jgi:hypothetical protein
MRLDHLMRVSHEVETYVPLEMDMATGVVAAAVDLARIRILLAILSPVQRLKRDPTIKSTSAVTLKQARSSY